MQESVKQERWKFIGGSDIAIILGISPFKTRFRLLQEKAQIVEPEEVDNAYTRYGNVMEEKIREYINAENREQEIEEFTEGKYEEEGEPIGFRCHTDGQNCYSILEIKTTSDILGNLNIYKAQLCFYMIKVGRSNGVLACYDRPEDMDETFDPDKLTVFYYTMDDFVAEGLVDKVNDAIDLFIADLQKLKENPFLAESDLISAELMEIADQVLSFEQRLAEIKAEEKAIEEQKTKLFNAMIKSNVKKWVTLNGTQITRVDPIATEHYTADEFDEKRFKSENADLYNKYLVSKEKTKSGRKGYVKITLPGEGKKGKKKK